ncbi:MAG: hypothetical protein Kow0089_08530 [Desulfobulbaceae bacterium]
MRFGGAWSIPVCLVILAAFFPVPAAFGQSAVMDPPHDPQGCLSCHDMTAFGQPKMIPGGNETVFTDICLGCHNDTEPTYGRLEVHSSATTSAKYGDWSVGCSVCHNQHRQDQNNLNGSTHGKFVRATIELSRIVDSALNPVKSGRKPVVFLGPTGPKSFADGDSTRNGICEVCHTQTTHFRNDGSGSDQLHSNMGSVAGTNCMNCHKHTDGFTGGGHDSSQFGWAGGCENCHGDGSATEAVVAVIHNNQCNLCHTTGGPYDASTNKVGENGDGDATLAEGDAGTWNSTCVTCHNKAQVPGFHGLTIADVVPAHQLSSDSSGGYDCELCHSANVANEQLATHMNGIDTPVQCATICHGNATPSDTSGIIARNVIDSVTFNDPAPNNNDSNCEDCHDAKGDFKLHGLSDDDSVADGIDDGTGGVAFHNNLGGSRGAFADSGGTIPAYRAAAYSGKIDYDTYNGLLAPDYNCADCHAADHASFTSLEAMRIHTFMQGSGSGTCLTCHLAPMVADEIAAGIAGSTVECEDCHSIANGNGPSGEKMYQYDGARHHKTVNAQAGNCTRCHADPRPPVITEGHAGTAAINGTWADGFDADFTIGYTHPGGMPTQMGCRLCHTNYETYTVDVRGDVDGDGDTSQLADKHGYNKNPPAHGLTVYADDFDARGTELAYPDFVNLHEIQGAHQVTQTPISSHRIDALDGSSKIDVLNFGACLSCHTVQIRHAAPVPAQDYDIPIAQWGAPAIPPPVWPPAPPADAYWANRFTHPYDTLRYSPGRSVFNDLRGGSGDAWNDHTKNWGWLAFNDNCCRGRWVFWNAIPYFDNVNNYSPNSLADIPVIGGVNQLEGFPGTATYNIRNFDAGPTLPGIDNITITVAQWTGSAVYVEATSVLGAAQSFSFTYTGAGGPCNTTMTWDTDHYEGTCIAASGWTPTDTVTVFNNTTAAADEKTRALSDLTIDPSVPVLAGITVSDSNGADPAPAMAGYTNDQSVTITLSASNYPTYLWLAEDSDFTVNSTGWVLYDTPYTDYSLSAGDGVKTVYAKVKNDAGESNVQSYNIVLDTTDPVVQADALLTPNGNADPSLAEFWTRGTNRTITWNNDVSAISDDNLDNANAIFLKYSFNSGLTWPLTIAGNEANDGSYTWNVNYSYTHTARVRLVVRDKAGNEAWDDSDNNFNVSTPYIVTNTGDSGAGSLRQVLADLLAAGGGDTVWFNIPDSDPGVVDGTAVIDVIGTDLPTIDQADIFIDGSSQTILQGDDNSNGPEVRINDGDSRVNGFNITADSVYFESLQVTGFTVGINSTGNDTSLEYCHLGFASSETGGYVSAPNSTNAILSGQYANVYNENYLACASTGLNISGSTDAWVDGNVFGMFPDGTACANSTYAIRIGSTAADPFVSDNVLSGSTYGIYIEGSTQRAVIRGNQIGVYYSGATWTDLPGPTYGIYISSNSTGGHTIGGPLVATSDAALRNSNVFGASNTNIYIYQTESYNYTKVYGNFIGTNPEEDEVFPGSIGIFARYIYGAYIGGSGAGEAGNVIANMSSYGFSVYSDGTGARYIGIQNNSFYANGDDSGDDAIYLSTSGNQSITRPTIDYLDANTVTVGGVYGGNGGTQAGDIVEVYLADFDGTEYGEGKTLVASGVVAFGQTTVDIDISGAGLSTGDWLTVLRTNHWPATPAYQTSAFSEHVRIPGPTAPTLDWTGEAGYTTDGVGPDSGLAGSTFTYRVQYADADNDSPSAVEVWVDINNNGGYEANEKFAMAEVNPADTVYSDGKDYTFSLPVGRVTDGLHDYRFYASDGANTAAGTPTTSRTFTVQACSNDLAVDPAGTYFEAEKFLVTVPQGSATFSQQSVTAGYNGAGYLQAGSPSSTTIPPTEEGKLYQLNFPTPGNYIIWIRAMGTSSSTRSVFTGADGDYAGALTTNFTYWTWIWTKSVVAGTSTINIGTAGDHTLNLWVRENGFRVDAFYITQGAETPSDATVPSGVKVIDPSVCTP